MRALPRDGQAGGRVSLCATQALINAAWCLFVGTCTCVWWLLLVHAFNLDVIESLHAGTCTYGWTGLRGWTVRDEDSSQRLPWPLQQMYRLNPRVISTETIL